MIRITNEAGTVLSARIPGDWRDTGEAFRLESVAPDQIALTHGPRQDGDVEVDYRGEPVLYVPDTLAQKLGDVTVDITHVDGGIALQVLKAA
jgi:hypothetical protein